MTLLPKVDTLKYDAVLSFGLLPFGDKSRRIFFNTTADLNSLPSQCKNMLEYIQSNTVSDDTTKRLDEIINDAIDREIWKEDYMLTFVHDMDVFRDGYESRQDEIDALNSIIADKDAALADLKMQLAQLRSQFEAINK